MGGMAVNEMGKPQVGFKLPPRTLPFTVCHPYYRITSLRVHDKALFPRSIRLVRGVLHWNQLVFGQGNR